VKVEVERNQLSQYPGVIHHPNQKSQSKARSYSRGPRSTSETSILISKVRLRSTVFFVLVQVTLTHCRCSPLFAWLWLRVCLQLPQHQTPYFLSPPISNSPFTSLHPPPPTRVNCPCWPLPFPLPSLRHSSNH
jgi:hypothetical protein